MIQGTWDERVRNSADNFREKLSHVTLVSALFCRWAMGQRDIRPRTTQVYLGAELGFIRLKINNTN